MLVYKKDFKELIENDYQIENEALHASLLTTGNGYFGVRGSFEEFGSVNIQGTFVRGLFDQIIEIPKIYVDNIYMRNYYIDEVKAKKFQYQDSAINFVDFLLIQVKIGDKIFYPWEGKILNWVRYIDTNTGALIRKVTWDDGFGHITELSYERFASFDDNHEYVLKCDVKKINHDLDCKIISGIDTLTKTNGQLKSTLTHESVHDRFYKYDFHMGNLYNMEAKLAVANNFYGHDPKSVVYKTDDNGRYYEEVSSIDQSFGVHKYVYVAGTMDGIIDLDNFVEKGIHKMLELKYEGLYNKHLISYQKSVSQMFTKLSDEEDDAHLRYANYQTLISVDRFSDVHSLSAKNLTGEKYNQFVWWDAEIYQFPIFLMTDPTAAKNTLMYRYNRLAESKNNAKNLNLDGAKFAFCSSVLGDEKVWSYARHPFMQIHINSDIAYAVIRYVDVTGDVEFLKSYGLEMLYEISKYWLSRVYFNKAKDQYEILQVTGTDEHHPYIDNNAYTNYLTSYILRRSHEWFLMYGYKEGSSAIFDQILRVSQKMYLPLLEDGMIPQFDGYFSLNPKLEVVGFGAAKGFQMKESGLYHESQIIKQPDVMMLYTYVDILNDKRKYNDNWTYYEEKCEASSSLTYSVHAIAAIDNRQYDSFYNYFSKTTKIDNLDLHNEAHLGLHAAALAGGWYSIFRGLFGFNPQKDCLEVNPKYFNRWEDVVIHFTYLGNQVKAKLSKGVLSIESQGQFTLKYQNEIMTHKEQTYIRFE